MKILHIFYFSLLLIFATACKSDKTANDANPETGDQPTISAIIEIPAGTNHKIEVNKKSGKFENDQLNGKDRVVDFLPYPGNYGFIPNTLLDTANGGDGDALDVLVIAESVPVGTKLEILPIAVLMLKDGDELDSKIIAVPADAEQQIIKAVDFQTFMIEYSMAQNIIQDWFLNYKGLGKVELLGWRDEQYATGEIKKWTVQTLKADR